MHYLECRSPLGMENDRIKDSQIQTSSVLKNRTTHGWQARLNRNVRKWGGWCLDNSGGSHQKMYDQYIQIDLVNITKVTGIATQGRSEHLGGREYPRDYKISYSKDGEKWNFFRGKDEAVKVNRIWLRFFMQIYLCKLVRAHR